MAVDGAMGEQVWKRSVIEDEPEGTAIRRLFIEIKGPSDAPVW
jgi:hypothetical protein